MTSRSTVGPSRALCGSADRAASSLLPHIEKPRDGCRRSRGVRSTESKSIDQHEGSRASRDRAFRCPKWRSEQVADRRAAMRRASAINPEIPAWIWPLRIPRGEISVIAADWGTGKIHRGRRPGCKAESRRADRSCRALGARAHGGRHGLGDRAEIDGGRRRSGSCSSRRRSALEVPGAPRSARGTDHGVVGILRCP